MDEPTSVRRIWESLGLPGIVDVHTHFMPKNVMDKVWQYFDAAGPLVGRPWPITYRSDEQARLDTLRAFGVRAFTSLVYPHKPDMAAWLNQWAARFAADTPDCLSTATFYPEPGAAEYVKTAITGGTRVFKVHVQVGGYDPTDPLLDNVWGMVAEAGIPIVIHCGSGPQPGNHTGPGPVGAVLRRHPRLRLIVAHMGMPEYTEFLDLAERYDVALDTTMAFTGFAEETMPFPATQYPRLRALGDRILWGSDFPNIPYGYLDAMTALTRLPGVDDDWLRAVFHHNGAALFGLN
ncbi:amidohydrolase [Mycolicibacterium canariasense]|uniref:Amidohydrolase n=1 Tax=Mycolicibacterium canariasense TaxID=228230 RepID=A0A100WDU4_MYCCR|nr:amidohydrolase family protein [Mycolicibacterium canariasense]MCV7209978.1 amidohydrolase [Mycolicibacterium canariasense]ORV05243.1 amidohydrolase [Mycolicibacterium canariasense]GAS96340.1 amidohydrolase [Mycolicibacterium canariasense]